uniref:Uncharacterized protein n=1 Tax=Trichuris muris TaxID=70415 RepID=A0A5S6Q249_TRIMR
MDEPVTEGEAGSRNKLKTDEDEEGRREVTVRQRRKAALRFNYAALEDSVSSDESEDETYVPDGEEGEDVTSEDEAIPDNKVTDDRSTNRSDGLGDQLTKYHEAFKLAICGVPPDDVVQRAADQRSKRARALTKVAPSFSQAYLQHFTRKVECINELGTSIGRAEKLLLECRLATELLKRRADRSRFRTVLGELGEIGSLLESFGVTNVRTSREDLKKMQARVDQMRTEMSSINSEQLGRVNPEEVVPSDSEQGQFEGFVQKKRKLNKR